MYIPCHCSGIRWSLYDTAAGLASSSSSQAPAAPGGGGVICTERKVHILGPNAESTVLGPNAKFGARAQLSWAAGAAPRQLLQCSVIYALLSGGGERLIKDLKRQTSPRGAGRCSQTMQN